VTAISQLEIIFHEKLIKLTVVNRLSLNPKTESSIFLDQIKAKRKV